jgi:hypothetical protein
MYRSVRRVAIDALMDASHLGSMTSAGIGELADLQDAKPEPRLRLIWP